MQDKLLPDVLLFPPGSDLHDHPLVVEGKLLLQVCPCLLTTPLRLPQLSVTVTLASA